MSTCVQARSRIEDYIRKRLEEGEKALITFITAGYPSTEFTVAAVERMLDAGSDIVEIGIPFSDPLADGPVIQSANTQALRAGTRTRDVFEVVSRIRSDGYSNPLVFLTYINTVYCYGVSRFIEDCIRVGIDGLVIPDLPVEERYLVRDEICAKRGPGAISLIPMVAPTSDDSRIEAILSDGSGFVYCVSTTGVTGVREKLPEEVTGLLERVRARTSIPLAVGFGIGDASTAAKAAQVADGVIVGSAIMSAIADAMGDGEDRSEEKALKAVETLVSSLKAALRF